MISFWQTRKLRLRLRNLSKMAQAGSGRGETGTQLPQLWSPGSNPAGRTHTFSLARPSRSCTDGRQAQEGTHSLPRLPSALGSLLGSLETGGLQLWSLQTTVITLSTSAKASSKGVGHTGLCTNGSPLLGLRRSELELLWPVARELHPWNTFHSMVSAVPKPAEHWPSTAGTWVSGLSADPTSPSHHLTPLWHLMICNVPGYVLSPFISHMARIRRSIYYFISSP